MSNNTSPYLELMKVVLTDYYPTDKLEFHPLRNLRPTWKIKILKQLDKLLNTRNFTINKIKKVTPEIRTNGYDWPANAYTMIGINRLNNIENCIRFIVTNKVEGDLVEAGLWRGGSVIFMKAVLKELNVIDRRIFAADSFKGLPKPDKNYSADAKNTLYLENILSVSIEEVKNNFKSFGLLDSSVIFLKGFFKETLPNAPIQKIALLRLDCDMYESTIIALNNLYHKVSNNGFVIIDDYNAFDECKLAVNDFRMQCGIVEAIVEIDNEAVYWQKNNTQIEN